MQRSTFKVLFYVKRQSEKSGQVPIMGRITINGTMSQFSCKLSVRSSLWDAKANKASGKSLESQRINEKLENIKTNIGKQCQRLCDRDSYVTAEKVRNAVLGMGDDCRLLLLQTFDGWIPVDPFAGFHVKFKYTDRRYLSASELQAVMGVELPNYRTGINRDVFVFCAFTDLSHSDVAKLTLADIHTDDNGERWIIDKRQKTGTQFRVKLLPVTKMPYNCYKGLYLGGNKVFPAQ